MASHEGRTAVITGASRGLGEGMAREFLRQGLRLALCARGAIPVGGDGVLAASVDVTDEAAVRAFAERAARHLGGRIDLWINNAGVLGPIAPLREVSPRDFAATLEVNVLGVVHGTRAYVEQVRRQGGGGVLLQISSGAGRVGFAGMAAYCASKAAVDRLTESVQAEEAAAGLRAHSVTPGMINTAMQERLRGSDARHLPDVDFYRSVHARGAFSSPAFIARELLALAFERAAGDVVVDLPPERAIR